jgi:hypothetical protein
MQGDRLYTGSLKNFKAKLEVPEVADIFKNHQRFVFVMLCPYISLFLVLLNLVGQSYEVKLNIHDTH